MTLTSDRSQKNLHVCNLPPVASDQDVWEIFAAHGEVESAMVVRDLHTGRSTRTAFVCFARAEDAAAARAALHKHRLDGEKWRRYQHKLSVQWAKKAHDAVPVGDARAEMRELFVRNVPLDVTEDNLRSFVQAHGTVVRVRLCEDTFVNAADPRRIAFVEFAEPGAADAALRALHDRCPFPSCRGVPLMCKLKEEKFDRPEMRSLRGGRTGSASLPILTSPCHDEPKATSSLCLTAPGEGGCVSTPYDAPSMFESPGLSLANMEAESQVLPSVVTCSYVNVFPPTFCTTTNGEMVPVYAPVCMPFAPIVFQAPAPVFTPTYTQS